jgi:hypothetical protein
MADTRKRGLLLALVDGDGDYGAMGFKGRAERHAFKTYIETGEFDDEEYTFNVRFKLFVFSSQEDLDKAVKLMNVVGNFITDYDNSKNTDYFYEILTKEELEKCLKHK